MADKTQLTSGRRHVLQVLAGSVGAGLAAPALATGEASHAHGHAAGSTAAQAGSAAAAPLPTLLDESELALLKSLAEAIVPARPRRVSRRSSTSSWPSTRATGSGTSWPRSARSSRRRSRATGSRGCRSTPRSRPRSDRGVDGPRSREPRYWKAGEPVLVPPPARVAPTLRDRFELLKDRIASAYYSSEKGMKELGWTGQMVHPSFPGCTHPDGHATSD
jgi:hypothetical protein